VHKLSVPDLNPTVPVAFVGRPEAANEMAVPYGAEPGFALADIEYDAGSVIVKLVDADSPP